MTIEQLESYRAVRAELEDIENELAQYGVRIAVQSASTAPFSKHTVTAEGLPPSPKAKALLERKAWLRARRGEVERFVDSIEDSEMRMIVLMKYIKGRQTASWQSIASKLGYCSEHTPKRKLIMFLDNLHK
jgi:hypothetical protein